jgi:hypothetical protein
LSESNGAALTPPTRVVIAARILAGTAQFGVKRIAIL